ncbi:MAG: hypothetical protein NUV97_01890 [archaeon]|nr:hypothetical protein [archaeon]MCR4323705.1 hypothetical protein [Nanoarchaeota archaeon]
MRRLSRLNKNHRGLSNLVAYVLLITITLSLSVLVYNWLRFYVSEDELPACPDGVNIIIEDYFCNGGSFLEVTLKNKGLFTVDGFTLRVHNRTGAELGFYTLNDTGVPILPGEEHITIAVLDNTSVGSFPNLTLVEVQPFMREGEKISCKSTASQKISCI